MKQLIPKKIALAILCALLAMFFLIKCASPYLTERFYANNQGSVIRFLADANGDESLAYYQGQLEDRVFGPLKSLFAGAALLMLCFVYMRHAGALVFGGVVLLYLVITRYDCMFNPPYGEAVLILSDSIWLARHAFDYAGYFQAESFVTGGPIHYATSIFPSIIAFLIAMTPSAKVFLFLTHSIVFVCGAIIVALFREILCDIFDNTMGMLGAITFVSLPLFQSMVEIINMEMLCTFFAIVCAYYLVKRNMALASVAAVLSLLIKAPGGIMCATVFIAGIMEYCVMPAGTRDKRVLLWTGGALGIALAKALLRRIIMGGQVDHNRIALLAGWTYMKTMVVLWIFFFCFAIFVCRCMMRCTAHKATVMRFLREEYCTILLFVVATLWFVLYLNFSAMAYRYELLLAPFFVFCVMYIFLGFVRKEAIARNSIVAAILFSFFCSHGLLYPPKVSSQYSHTTLERSLEYRNDLALHMNIARDIEKNFSDFTIGAPFLVAQMLAIPEFGYVDKQLDVILYGGKPNDDRIRTFSGLSEIDIKKTVWIGYLKNYLPIPADVEFSFPMSSKDLLLQTAEIGNKKMVLFMGGYAIDVMRKVVIAARLGLL